MTDAPTVLALRWVLGGRIGQHRPPACQGQDPTVQRLVGEGLATNSLAALSLAHGTIGGRRALPGPDDGQPPRLLKLTMISIIKSHFAFG